MDDVESVESFEESLDDYGPKAVVTVGVKFKSGMAEEWKFNVPCWTAIYGEPVTASSIYEIVASAFSMGEVPFVALPKADNSYVFFDLSAADTVTVRVDDV